MIGDVGVTHDACEGVAGDASAAGEGTDGALDSGERGVVGLIRVSFELPFGDEDGGPSFRGVGSEGDGEEVEAKIKCRLFGSRWVFQVVFL